MKPLRLQPAVERLTRDAVAGINGLTFAEGDTNDDYVRKITPIIRGAICRAIEYARKGTCLSHKARNPRAHPRAQSRA